MYTNESHITNRKNVTNKMWNESNTHAFGLVFTRGGGRGGRGNGEEEGIRTIIALNRIAGAWIDKSNGHT